METRLTVLGGGGVGKSTLTIRYTLGHYVDDYDPTVEDTYRKPGLIDGKPAMMLILDTAGQEQYAMMRDSWMRAGDAFLLLFDVSARGSYDEIDDLVAGIMRVKDQDSLLKIPTVLIGNKCDITGNKRQVSRAEAEEKARKYGCSYCETSAKEAIGIEEGFETAVRLHRQLRDVGGDGPSQSLSHARRVTMMKNCVLL